MSLKAYDGMMTRKGFHYLQEKIVEHLPEFRKASVEKILKTYATCIYKDADGDLSLPVQFELMSHSNETHEELKKIKIDDKTTILSYVFQSAKVLSKSFFVNDFCTHLFLTIDSKKPKKLLVYPNLLVDGHREILLSFLEDWYAQNQCDPDDSVSSKEWSERCDDWWNFNENRGMWSQIRLFDPQSYKDNIVDSLRGEELVDGILKFIPSDEERILKIHKHKFLNILVDRIKIDGEDYKANAFSYFYKAGDYMRSEEGQKELEEYIKSNPISVIKIDKEYLNSQMNDKLSIG